MNDEVLAMSRERFIELLERRSGRMNFPAHYVLFMSEYDRCSSPEAAAARLHWTPERGRDVFSELMAIAQSEEERHAA
jgi:hypothetical protein